MVIYAQPGQILHLGRYTSSQQTTIIFDVSAWKDQITNDSRVVVYYGLVDKIVTPKTTCYGSTLIDNNYQVSWTVDSDTTSIVGEGRCEVALLEGDTHTALSYYWQTVVSNSIYNNDTTTPAEVYENYIDRMGREYDAINALDVTTDWIDYSETGSITKEVVNDHLVLNFHLPRAPEFQIRKNYLSLDAMYQDFANCAQYDFCIIDTGNVEEETTAQLYMVGAQPSTGITYTVSHITSFPPASPSASVLYVLDNDVTYQGTLYKKHDGVVWVNNTWIKAYIYLADLSGIKGEKGVGVDSLRINPSSNELQYRLVDPATGHVTEWYTITGASFYTQIATYAANALTASSSAAMWVTGTTTPSTTPSATNNAAYYASQAAKWVTGTSTPTTTPGDTNNAAYWATVAHSWATDYSENNAKYWADQAHSWATTKPNDNASYYASTARSWATGGSTGTPGSKNNALYYANQASLWATNGEGGTPTSENNAKYWATVAHSWATDYSENNAKYYANQASNFADDAEASEKQAAKWVTGTSTPATEPGSTNNAVYYVEQAKKWANFSATGDPTSKNNAKYWADEAQAWANSKPNNNASYYASIARAWANGSLTGSPTDTNNALYYKNGAEAWADGTVNGTPITSTGAYASAYNNNARYWAQLWSQAFTAWSSVTARIKINPSPTQPLSSAFVSLYEHIDPTSGKPYKEFYFEMPFNTGININKVYTILPSNTVAAQLGEGTVIAVGTEKPYTLYISNGSAWIEAGEYGINDIDSQKGQPNGLAELDGAGLVPASQLPSYVDDVLEFNTRNDFPATGESGKVYIAKDTNVTYRWSGSTYAVIGSDLALGETSSTAYRGDRGKTAYDHATEAARLSTAQRLGFYKVATTAQGHIGQVSAVTASDITALNLPYMQKGVDYVTAGQKSGTTLGVNATIEGISNTASGYNAHAEGANNIASGDYSHVEGSSNSAVDSSAHAEGLFTVANNKYSHAEGQESHALGQAAHAEGQSWSFGPYAHAEGLRGSTLLTLTGSGYTYTVSSPPDRLSTYKGGVLFDESGTTRLATITDVSENTLTLNATLDTITGQTFLACKGAIGLASHTEGYNNIAQGEYSHAEGQFTSAVGEDSHAEGRGTIASGKTSHSEGLDTTASSSYSHAEGSYTTASANSAHAEGGVTVASGNYSHAEGSNTTASGHAAHAEGNNNTASGQYSHAEGINTTASANSAHAEGYATTASGENAHAEGDQTTASGSWSHAEGLNTIAKNQSNHVFGAYNIADPSSSESSYKGTYIEIVGNGTSISSRSNARTLDWSGNQWLAGTIKVGGTSYDDTNAKELATKDYVDSHTPTFTISEGTLYL